MDMIEFDRHRNEIAVLPVIGIMRVCWRGCRYRYRVVLWWLWWQVSIGVWREKYGN